MRGAQAAEMGSNLSMLDERQGRGQVLSSASLSVTCRVPELAFVGLVSVRGSYSSSIP